MLRIPKKFDREAPLDDLTSSQLRKICKISGLTEDCRLSKEEIIHFLSPYKRMYENASLYDFYEAIKHDDEDELRKLLLFSYITPFPNVIEQAIFLESEKLLSILFQDERIDDYINLNVFFQAVETGNPDVVKSFLLHKSIHPYSARRGVLMARRFGYDEIVSMIERYIHQNISEEEEREISNYYVAIKENDERALMILLHENRMDPPSEIVKEAIKEESPGMVDIILSSGRVNVSKEVNMFLSAIETGKKEMVEPFLLYNAIDQRTAERGKKFAKRLGYSNIHKRIKKYHQKM